MTQSEHEASSREDAIAFSAELTIAQSGEYYQRFAECIEQSRNVLLDGAAVTRIDAAFIQLLCQVQRALAETSHGLQWTAPSEALSRSIELLGMSEHLALAEVN